MDPNRYWPKQKLALTEMGLNKDWSIQVRLYKKSRLPQRHIMAGKPGLEPGTADPESSVLPLHHFPARGNYSGILYYKKGITLIRRSSYLFSVLLILAQVSRKDTVRLNTSFFAEESVVSTKKYPSLSN